MTWTKFICKINCPVCISQVRKFSHPILHHQCFLNPSHCHLHKRSINQSISQVMLVIFAGNITTAHSQGGGGGSPASIEPRKAPISQNQETQHNNKHKRDHHVRFPTLRCTKTHNADFVFSLLHLVVVVLTSLSGNANMGGPMP